MKYKGFYLGLGVLSVVYTLVITFLNIMVYGSVMQWNLSVLSLLLIMPIYMGFKMKSFHKKTVVVMAVYMLAISILAALVMPKYTYDEAFKSFEQPVKTLRKHVGEKSFFYKGNYYVKSAEGNFSFDIKTGDIKGVDDEFK